ncbi:von Willebrand factor A domain-containing protein 5A [Perognathus longimembris pacificus]|uniref:von Willebrand factor A domain-containing protein 5A n=1 Tax=Perognathus longimembris pacificus TaxID=214514 RepID=UPI00201912D0|nr:von Willebrand factor A domain-containing protein 5A [Perognathus longimembris pacificus]
MVRASGLLAGQNKPVALKSISVELSICEFVASVSATLNYENEENVPLEAFFVFPMDEDSAVYSFEALVDEKRIVAELQDKMKAHQKYEEALAQGYQAYLLEEDACSRDVFRCNVGNLQPGAKVALTLKYVQELPLEADGALRYVLPAVLNPRYHLAALPGDSSLDLKSPLAPLEQLPYTLRLRAALRSQHGVQRVQSNCALSPLAFPGGDKTCAQVSLEEGHKFDRDVELLVYYTEVHSPSVVVEMGDPEAQPDSLMGDAWAMVSFYPEIPEVEASRTCGEFVFLMDRSGSMQCPMGKENRSQTRIEAAKETLVLLLKSLPMGCYFNIYGFGASYEAFFPESVKYTQKTMEEAVERVKLMAADLGGTEILTPLQNVFRGCPIPGHPLQVFVFTDGEVAETFHVIKQVKFHSKRHRCFSFGIGEGASTSLIKNIARVSGGTAEFITGKDRMQAKALRSLERSLQSVVEDVSLSWDLPPGLSVSLTSPEQTAIFRGQRLIVYAQLSGVMPPTEATGEVCLKYTLQGKSFENKVTFLLQPKPDANLTLHRLAAKSLIQTKDLGFRETIGRSKMEVLRTSLESGVMSSFTAFVAINKELNEPVQGPMAHREMPRPVLFSSVSTASRAQCYSRALAATSSSLLHHRGRQSGVCAALTYQRSDVVRAPFLSQNAQSSGSKGGHKVRKETAMVLLIYLQNADGSWNLDGSLAQVLGLKLEDMQTSYPDEQVDGSDWATMLAVLWLHANCSDRKGEWHLLERKAVAWLHSHAGPGVPMLVKKGNAFLKCSVNPRLFR